MLCMMDLYEVVVVGDVQVVEYLLFSGELDLDGEDWDWGKRMFFYVVVVVGMVKIKG